jgi:hypothetical protein
LFAPPNVGGFPHGMGWLSPSTVLGRYYLAATFADKASSGLPSSGDVEGWANRLGLASVSEATAASIREFVASTKTSEANKQRGVMILLLVSPDWMVV